MPAWWSVAQVVVGRRVAGDGRRGRSLLPAGEEVREDRRRHLLAFLEPGGLVVEGRGRAGVAKPPAHRPYRNSRRQEPCCREEAGAILGEALPFPLDPQRPKPSKVTGGGIRWLGPTC
jgi:hypothetical protein